MKSLQTGVWKLGSTDKEAAVSNWNTTETPEGDSLLRMLCFESEAKTLHHDLFLNCGHSASYEVKPNAKGSNQVNAEFLPVKFAIQIGENRLGWATSGYFYHFIDSQLVREYKVVGKGSWTCQATRSDKLHLTDELISEHHIGSFLLPYRIEGEIFSEQHILYREVKLTADELAKADSTWLSENAMKLNLESIIAIRYNELLYREPEQKDASPVERQKVSHSVQINPITGERETWPEIASQYGLSAKDLLDLNPAYHDDPMRLKAGDNLQVSKAVVHEPVESSEISSPIVSLSDVHAFGDVWGLYNQREFGDKAVNIFPTSSIEDHVPVLNVCRIDVPVSFSLGWMQIEQTQSQAQLWAGLFTEETSESQQQLIKNYNVHLNEPVRQGEIVILPTAEPENDSQKQALNQLLEEAQAASTELGKLNEEQVATANRHFELLDYYASEALRRVKADGLPSDEYAYASVGVGAVASGVGQHLNNINGVLQEINNLYVSQVALGSRSGGINYGQFVNERAALFKKLDGSFARLSSRSIQLPINQQIRRALNLSTKSIVHNADEIIAKGIVPNLGK
ncbi:MIX and LysM peptidoglycan-binding domain-containing protein [Photobacterium halotolerans]|uniref:MIX and LysM peptidoglycan-binding domain-containing protein n=1 Tax=Photobacterium halotolerans TaxID=265726 RepID=UPI001F1BB809|nr:hypothetical protein [Photobacterium halotolerans]